MIYNLYKNRGETPLACLERFRVQNSELEDVPMTYLGRLDPMADGVLLVGAGIDASQEVRQKYFGLDKEYEFQMLFGFSTDTYDCLGLITAEDKEINKIATDEIKKIAFEIEVRKVGQIYVGERVQKLPKFSSKIISGFDLADIREDKILEENLSEKKIMIYDLKFSGLENITSKELFGRLLSDIGKVKGDFRQIKILGSWKDSLVEGDTSRQYLIGKFTTCVSSGTYIRSLVNDMATTLGTKACAFSITRTKLGDFDINDSIRF